MKHLFTLLLSLFVIAGASSQVTIHNWNFNVGTPGAGSEWPTSISATTGTGILTHNLDSIVSFTGTTLNAEGGDVAGGCFVPVGMPLNGDTIYFAVPTTGYVGIILSYATRGTSTGFTSQEILYSLDGSTYISDTTITGITTSFDIKTVNLSDISGADNNPNFKIAIRIDGASSAGGNNRYDNVKIQGFLPGVNDGDGTATVLNNTGTFSGSTIFTRNTGGQTVLTSVTGVPGGTLTSVRLTLPSGWSGLSAPNVTLGGAFTSLSPTVGATTITLTGTTLGTTPGTIQISGLTSNNPVGALNNGNSTWLVETAKSGGTLTAIASSPKSHTIIPIENLKTGGVDGFGNTSAAGDTSAMNGNTVAVQGIATVQNQIISSSAAQTSFFIQHNGYGVQVFRAAAPSVTWARGDDMVIKGTIETFDGTTEVVPQTGASPNFYNLGAGVLPAPTVLANAGAINESQEGKLVQVNSVTWDFPGSSFSSTVGPVNSFRTSPTDSSTLFLSSTNVIVGSTIPTSSIAIGIVYHRKSVAAGTVPEHKLASRDLVDLGNDPADGTGTAVIVPAGRVANQVAVAETLTVTGNGTHTLGGVSVTIPSSWTWNGSSYTLAGTGFSGASSAVTGDGSGGNPWVITVNSASVTNVNTGIIRISNLGTPAALGSTTFTTKTRGASGSLANVAAQPTVNIGSAFEAIASGNWSDPATWAGNAVPTASDDVTMTTLGVTVTIDIDGAVCNNLTITGSGTASNSGPVLQFDTAGTRSLTVNGNLTIGGGSGGGSGDRGGRPKFWSNGNNTVTLTAKKNVTSTSSNSPANGDAGLSMNSGVVKLTGATTDTLRFGAGIRLGSLEIGDGTNAKTVYTAMNTSARLAIISLEVKTNSNFWIGTGTTTNVLTVGNAFDAGVPLLTGGITIGSGASLRVQESTAGFVTGTINFESGSITNNGTIDMHSTTFATELTGCVFNMNVGGISQGSSGQNVNFGGSGTNSFANVTIDSAHTLTLNAGLNVTGPYKMTIKNGTLAETAGNTVIGTVEATRTVGTSLETFGGMGIEVDADVAPGSTVATRTTGSAIGGSIQRYFNLTPTVNSGLNATLTFRYDESELNGNVESILDLYKSTDGGSTWSNEGGTPTPASNLIQLTGVNSMSRWVAADTNNPLSSFSVNVGIAAGWNILSNPVGTVNDSVHELYPTSTFSYGFAFSPSLGYQQSYTMENGVGYWSKFPGATTQNVSGSERTLDSIDVEAGWNIIGSISQSVDTSTVVSVPPGIRTSQFFGYNGGYTASQNIEPGKGYWVKANAPGQLILDSPAPSKPVAPKTRNPIDGFSTVTITDKNGASQTLYLGTDASLQVEMFEMPPFGPDGVFDARFASNRMAEVFDANAKNAAFGVEVRATAYPLTVAWEIKGDRKFALNQGTATTEMNGAGRTTITNPSVKRFTVTSSSNNVPTEFTLQQNYPNPFNPATTISFGLPADSRVTLRVFNLLGQQVAEIANGVLPAGFHDFTWNGKSAFGTQVGTGVYFYKMEATSVATAQTFAEVRKMVLMK